MFDCPWLPVDYDVCQQKQQQHSLDLHLIIYILFKYEFQADHKCVVKVKTNKLNGLTWFQHIHSYFHSLFSACVVTVVLAFCCYAQMSGFPDRQESFSKDDGSRCPWEKNG